MALTLVIGNKNYSSWSMRPWVLMAELDIAFTEHMIPFGDHDFTSDSSFSQAVRQHSPAGLVPVLVDDGFAVWDTLAIAEYLHERFPQSGVWPADARARARARSISAEMHSGFGALRGACPMNIEARFPEVGQRLWAEREDVRRNVARIETLWADALAASGGPFLFGRFGAADAFFAPVCMRVLGYELPVSDTARTYVQRVAATGAVQRWVADALAEHRFVASDEPYRTHR